MMDNFLSSRHDGIGISSMTTSTVMYLSEGEEEIVFPRRNVKEAVQRWEREFGTRTTMMTTVDLESSIQQMDDHFHDECDEENTHTGSTQRRPDPPTDDKDDSVTQQLLLPSRSLAASPSTEKRQSQCSFRPDPDERQVRRPPYEWFQPLPSLSSPSTTSSRETHHRCCNSTFIRALCLMVSTGLLMVVFILPWRLQLQTQSSEQQLLHFIDFLAGHGISTRDELLTYESPQYRAAAWSVQRKSDEDALNRYVLAVLYFSLNGDSWPVPFLSDRHVCDWNTQINQTLVGVTGCRRQESGIRVPTQIVLALDGLSGTLPSEIRHLSHLEILHINHNLGLGGSLPTSIRRLTRLQSLSFTGCSIGGTIPTWVGELTQLEQLMLSDNRLRGSIPSEMLHLTNLQMLKLNGNLLSSSLHLLAPLTNLQRLNLHDNLIQGHIDESIFSNWTHLLELNLSENHLSGSLSTFLFDHTSLQHLDLHGNRLTGTIPLIPDTNTALTSLRLHSNELEGQIPLTISRLMTLQDLDLSGNMLTGTLPEGMSSLSNLKALCLGDNDYTPHSFSPVLVRLVNLQTLSLSRSNLTGKLPDSIGFLSKLQTLDLSENSIRGSLPESLGYLSLLQHLSLRNNLFTGTLPETLNQWNQLDEIFLESNFLTGTAENVCSQELTHFSSDCGVNSSFACSCCTKCFDITEGWGR